ncbi:hypothetical protein ACIRCZ_03595 [Leifsonia sp. NPDC102414]|uniref:hypothetical protein n=1 Tax=Leifsonia sp. NPDC102414 TaxID=3364124 RepID=UPI003815A2B0
MSGSLMGRDGRRQRETPPAPLRVAVALLLLVGLVVAVQFIVTFATHDWQDFAARASHTLEAKGVFEVRIPAMVGTTVALGVGLMLVALVISELPVLCGWLVFRGRVWARILLTVLVGLTAILSLTEPSPTLALDAASIAATVLLWLPSSSAFIHAEHARRKVRAGRGASDAKSLARPD